MVVKEPVDPTIVAHKFPFSTRKSSISFSSAGVMSRMSGPVSRPTLTDLQKIDNDFIFLLHSGNVAHLDHDNLILDI
jgi:hypothetical protein